METSKPSNQNLKQTVHIGDGKGQNGIEDKLP